MTLHFASAWLQKFQSCCSPDLSEGSQTPRAQSRQSKTIENKQSADAVPAQAGITRITQMKGIHTLWFNRRHGRVGHAFG